VNIKNKDLDIKGVLMQTFIFDDDLYKVAGILDTKRLGKQRVEAIQIARILTGITPDSRWKNHPAVLMWKGYEAFLIKKYIRTIMDVWVLRNYNNDKCEEHYKQLIETEEAKKEIIKPSWLKEDFYTTHKSNLLRKNFDYYKRHFDYKKIRINMSYIWPSKKIIK